VEEESQLDVLLSSLTVPSDPTRTFVPNLRMLVTLLLVPVGQFFFAPMPMPAYM